MDSTNETKEKKIISCYQHVAKKRVFNIYIVFFIVNCGNISARRSSVEREIEGCAPLVLCTFHGKERKETETHTAQRRKLRRTIRSRPQMSLSEALVSCFGREQKNKAFLAIYTRSCLIPIVDTVHVKCLWFFITKINLYMSSMISVS